VSPRLAHFAVARAAQAVLCASALSGCLKIPTADAPATAPDAATRTTALVAWPGKPPGSLYAPGETRVFDLIQGGKKIGTSWGRYDGPIEGGLHRFSTRVELRAPQPDKGSPAPEPLRSVGEIVLDARGELLRGFERSKAVELRFERSGETLVFTSGREREELGFRDGTAFMAFATMFHEELMFGLRELREGPLAWRLISLSGSLPSDWSATLTVPDATAPTIAVLSTSLGEVIHLRDGRIERVEVSADDLEVIVPAKPAAWPTWTIDAPPTLTYAMPPGATFTRRELELPGQPGEPKLVGELLIPPGAGPFPALLFLSSTGQQDRHGFAGPPPVDLGSHEITDALAQAGFVVLRYDERGFGGSAEGSISYNGQLEDARRGLRTLLVQDEVDPDRIAIVGHGEGGWKGLQLAGEGRGIRAVALLASPGRPYEEVLKAQAAAAVDSVPPELRAEVKKTQERTLAALRTGINVPPELERSAPWIREALQVDPDALIARAEAALWFAQGERDFEVDPGKDSSALARLARKHRKPHTVQLYPQLDHLFKPETGTSNPARYLEPGRAVDPGFLADLRNWLAAQLKRGASPSPARPAAAPRAR
jgi:pimeloyl-ACP methyl ester carboxylesterase